MNTSEQSDTTETYSTSFTDDMLDLFGGSNWIFHVDHISDSDDISTWDLDLSSTELPLIVEGSRSLALESSSPVTLFEEEPDCTNSEDADPIQDQKQGQCYGLP